LERVGGNRTLKVDVRVIATTNRRLDESVEKKEFRQDLFFRLNVVPIHIPPLRERLDDVPLLAQEVVRRFSRKHGAQAHGLTPEALRALQAHHWPGNVRELQNVIERAVICARTARCWNRTSRVCRACRDSQQSPVGSPQSASHSHQPATDHPDCGQWTGN